MKKPDIKVMRAHLQRLLSKLPVAQRQATVRAALRRQEFKLIHGGRYYEPAKPDNT